MSDHSGMVDLIHEIKETSRNIEAADHKNGARLDAL
jgi:hypothetical protein